ncbi:M48 family metallopeptidase [Marinobacter psychrophilus]|uniref:M48 metallopeptidase family protein n=1 Tax=Marinobacter psychrophilus TaxID=330734 RepID=UPI0018DB51F8|nr:M48 family metallopeptidase [Marinobacter psychrophilus]MBQ0844417.1 M48 family metallopeptidase [Marinobacter psychrophilus]
MKTKWGSCSIDVKRIWLNLELAKKPPECLEYILVHELIPCVSAGTTSVLRRS